VITIKTKKEIETMRQGGKKLAQIMKKLQKEVAPGIKTIDLEKLAQDEIKKAGALPSFLGYGGFPSVLCTSINEEIVHGVPSERILKQGDIISLDLGLIWKGFHADMAKTFAVGEIDFETKRLLKVTKKVLKIAINKVKPLNTFGDIGNTIQRYVESQGFNVVRELCGHGIGKELHEDPQVFNFGKRKTGPVLKEGMVFCIEPMVTIGDFKVQKKGQFTYKTVDNSLSCHFEHMVAVTEQGSKILTEI